MAGTSATFFHTLIPCVNALPLDTGSKAQRHQVCTNQSPFNSKWLAPCFKKDKFPATVCHASRSSFSEDESKPLQNSRVTFLKPFATVSGIAIGSGLGFFIAGGKCDFSILRHPFLGFIGGGSGNGGGGAGGDGNGGDGHGEQPFKFGDGTAVAAGIEDEERFDQHGLRVGSRFGLDKLSPSKRYKISDVQLLDRRTSTPVPKDDPFLEMVSLRPTMIATRAQLQEELTNLSGSGMFESVTLDALANPDGSISVEVQFSEAHWEPASSVRCVNVGLLPQEAPPPKAANAEADYYNMEAQYQEKLRQSRQCLLPEKVEKEMNRWLLGETRLTARMLQKIRDRVNKWYHDEGYACAQVVNFGNLNTDQIVCEVVEGDITSVDVEFYDKLNLPTEGNTNPKLISRELPKELKAGMVFNIEAGKKALQCMNSLGLFANIEVNPRADENLEGGIIVDVKLKETDPKTADVSTEWSIAPGDSGKPSLVSIQPGGSVTFEHRNINGLNRSLFGSVSTSNLLNPQDDVGFKLEYVHPYIDGLDDEKNRTGRVSCFNNRKLSAVFVGSGSTDEVPIVWVDRVGLKATVTENISRQSKITYGFVAEEVTTRNENTEIVTHGPRITPNGALSMDGPPTTHSDSGIDRVAFFLGNLTRDNTAFVRGTLVGPRLIFQVEQGLGLGSKNPFFNRHQISATNFIQISEEDDENPEKPPIVAVLHGRYGGVIGDLASYDAYTLGGPYSVRGYNMGEIGACRRFLELASEIRVPVKNTYVYGFAELGTDLGSSVEVRGNPTEFFRRVGYGASYGAGVKLGAMRAEYAVDCNAGAGNLFVRFGDRF